MSGSNDRAPKYTSLSKVAALLVIAHIGFAGIGLAEESTAGRALTRPSSRIVLLEEAFWHCDYAATIHGIDATPMEACGAVYTALKDEKFQGSFENLLRWWSANKADQHLSIQTAVEGRY